MKTLNDEDARAFLLAAIEGTGLELCSLVTPRGLEFEHGAFNVKTGDMSVVELKLKPHAFEDDEHLGRFLLTKVNGRAWPLDKGTVIALRRQVLCEDDESLFYVDLDVGRHGKD